MAKRKTNSKVNDKTRVELRFDTDLYERVKATADEAEISVNQLLQGIARWAMGNAHVGEPDGRDRDEAISTVPTPGCVWFGREDIELLDDENFLRPCVYFALDFTERRVVREEWPGVGSAEQGEKKTGMTGTQRRAKDQA